MKSKSKEKGRREGRIRKGRREGRREGEKGLGKNENKTGREKAGGDRGMGEERSPTYHTRENELQVFSGCYGFVPPPIHTVLELEQTLAHWV